ncbi:unnamed protein product, partial [Wuchereria bancrofti]
MRDTIKGSRFRAKQSLNSIDGNEFDGLDGIRIRIEKRSLDALEGEGFGIKKRALDAL